MTVWDWMLIVLSGAALFALVLGAFVTYAVRKNEEATRELIREMKARTRAELERLVSMFPE